MNAVSLLRTKRTFPRFLNSEEIKLTLKHCPSDLYNVVYTLLKTGLRSSELCELKTQKVDLLRKELKILKKSISERIIPFDDNLRDLLYREIQKHPNFPYVFINQEKRKINPHRLLRRMKLVYKNAGLYYKQLNVHILKHTFIADLVMSDVVLVTVQ